VPLAGLALDDVFSGLVRGADGLAVFRIEGKAQSITVECGPQYPVAVVYAPPGRNFICFEPMTAITNALNAAQAGWYKHLPSVAPGETWTGVYRIRPAGF
jgi:aldose 1-epimerase